MKAFPFKDAMDPYDPLSVKPRAEGLVNAWTEDYRQGLLNQATEHYRQSNYKAALASLNEAIQSYDEPPLGAYNVRAATHMKLGNLSDALKDAGRMIRKYESHPTGYLRLAQVLKMQGRPADALRIYEKGLLRVPPTVPQFQDIQDSRDRLSSTLAPKKLLDPLKSLPEELALEIMGRFHFRDIVRASQSYDSLRELSIGADSAQTVVVSHGFSKANLRRFEASPNVNFNFETACQLLDQCPLLECAIFDSFTRFSGLGPSPNQFGTFATLRRLHICCPGEPVPLYDHLIKRIPNIQDLSLERCRYAALSPNQVGLSELHQLETLRLFDSVISGNLKLPTSLKSISLEHSVGEATILGQLRVHVPELKRINLSRYVHRAGPMTIQALLGASTANVEYLNLSYMSADQQYMADVFRGQVVANVEALGLAGLPVSDDNLAYLGSVASRLKRINLSSTLVSGVGVKALVNGCKDTLTWIKLDNCRKVSPDAIEWARSCGIDVSYYFRDGLAGGRAVRDI
ncbi:MAG: hypothetical protein OHK93_001306 [Ramalina farinacea]|uniref:F-box domain-containing protein n=1 Tax=Ramalina farinacea TaxID=258253 RepID=A0AA43QS24_9LECA|nr:hypothetical protein [Ramalina farinacea]